MLSQHLMLLGAGALFRSGYKDVTYVEHLSIAGGSDIGVRDAIEKTRARASAIELSHLTRATDTATRYADIAIERLHAAKTRDLSLLPRPTDGHGQPFAPGAVHYVADWTFTHRDRFGKVIWTDTIANALVDVGEQRLLETYFKASATPTAFYISLSDTTNPCSVGETDSLATANTGEPATNGYARGLVERSAVGWPTSALDAGDWQLTSSTEVFTASGAGWGPVNCAVLQTTADNTGDHVAFVALSQARTLAASETLDVSLKVKLQ